MPAPSSPPPPPAFAPSVTSSAVAAPVTAPAVEERQRPTSIEYVTVPGSPAGPAIPATLGMEMYSFAPPTDQADRTPNGLRKRSPRARKPEPTVAAASGRNAERPPPVRDSPEDVRARLTALRSGIQRGSTDRP